MTDTPTTTRKRPGPKPTGRARVHLTMRLPQWLYRAISDYCLTAGITRTAYIETKLQEGFSKPPEEQP